ncbi:MAG TPA: hypothetical protein VN604_02105 [Nitrospirota bacterium]|nr:hypothetical protein [Nitrospirota bacterium]
MATADDDDVRADCIISILAEGEPLKASYGVSGDLFTGARLSGTIRIERPSLHKDEVRFSGLIKPPRRLLDSDAVDYKRPENAPFVAPLGKGDEHPATGKDTTAFEGFTSQLANLMGRYFGRNVLLIALDDHASKGELRKSAVEALAALGKPSAPFLIDAFRYCSPTAEKGVGEALEMITGEKYGTDAKRWNEWLNRQEQRK